MKVALWIAALAWLAGCGAGPVDAVTVDPGTLRVGLVAHWAFDEGSGTVVGDRSGNGHDGQLMGGTWLPRGRFGGALDMTSGDSVTVTEFPQATAGWTVSVWIRMSAEQLTLGTMEEWETILTNENVYAGGWQLNLVNRSGNIRYEAGSWAGSTVNDYAIASCRCVEADRWTHLSAVFDGGARELLFYRDGTVTNRLSLPTPILPGDSTLYVGRWNLGGRPLTATIDDFAIWSRALGAAEIAIIFRQPPPDPA